MAELKPDTRVAIHGRVSTRDKGLEVENQLAQLREFAAKQGRTNLPVNTPTASLALTVTAQRATYGAKSWRKLESAKELHSGLFPACPKNL